MLSVHPKPRFFFSHVMSKAYVGILRWALRVVDGPDRPLSQKGTDNADVALLADPLFGEES